MSARAGRNVHGALAAALLAAVPATAQPAPAEGGPSRAALRELSRALEGAVRQAVGPAPLAAFGGPVPARGYRLRGQGAVIVLPPVSLPRQLMVFQGRSAEPSELDDVARQVAQMEREAERARREAEQAFERVRRQIRIRLGEEGGPLPRPPPQPEAPPPWSVWFRIEESREADDPAQVIAAVRTALSAALAAHGPGLPGLGRDELLTVAVDFVQGGLFGFGPSSSRTLIARVRGADLARQRAGELTAEQLRERIAYDEY